MKIEKGIQSNCSEIIIPLPVASREEALAALKEIGISEKAIENFWGFENTGKEPVIREPTQREVEAKVKEDSGEELSDEEFKIYQKANLQLIDKDNLRSPDLEHRAYMKLTKMEMTGPSWWSVVCHQHCQVQLFPSVKKIAEFFGTAPLGDGGGAGAFEELYEEWLKEEDRRKRECLEERRKEKILALKKKYSISKYEVISRMKRGEEIE